MTRKRRMFDINMPDDPTGTSEGAPDIQSEAPSPSGRRGPMASAIAENAEALQARKTAAEAIREENDALAHEFVSLQKSGNVVQAVPLEEVFTVMLVRDRIPGDDPELDELVTSIRDLGLSNPIRVIPRPDGGGYELVQGYRRLCAYEYLLANDGQAWAKIPALILPGEADIAGLYRRMVDENVIRKDLSFAEMAHAAKNYADDPETRADNLTDAVAELFQSAPYSKRSYIRSFAYLLDMIGDALRYPTEIPRALGVNLAREIRDHPEKVEAIKSRLEGMTAPSVEAELSILRDYLPNQSLNPEGAKEKAEPKQGAVKSRSKTTFHIQSSAGQVKCTAAMGRLEIKVNRDFSAIERARLEAAIASLIDGLA